ncbi:lipoate synthase [Wigglesworthia glossinidia endosymbiont of Glossina morsitans morsitans (Yale colony)]|uniref:Lipoyl synthase n=1 Tax=Wigglesworthia glossinidia endosymbiont of Glossina morsitans morsitans (Yale colony) TaxID=1142511 RepID=H6Q5D8_WIGGL|nr:lipoyl synthase [Wigglesworthia glossinidia]AFA41421.1 lipoate synthase [Wigglesworthia glossinidia endosymbiont of Glossina morsitans morsitans (Yale colony)]
MQNISNKQNKNIISTITLINRQDKLILNKPNWLKIKLPTNTDQIDKIKKIIKSQNLHTVCEEAACPNLPECFNRGTATFMILGAICTRRCPFCNVMSGRPKIIDKQEPEKLANTVIKMQLKHVVITSVNRDDLKDGGAQQFADCIYSIRKLNFKIKIEILVPDFRGCNKYALNILNKFPPDIFNHNIESVPRLYAKVRPGAKYDRSIKLLKNFNLLNPKIPTKSGLMLGLGETKEEVIQVMKDLRQSSVSMLTIGQYLRPTPKHLPVVRYVHPEEFSNFKKIAINLGFTSAMCGPFVRSSYHAEKQKNNI